MLERIEGMPDQVLAVRAKGEVTAEDLEQVLLPGLKELTLKYKAIYYLLVLETDVESFTAGAWYKDMLAGVKHFRHWKKMAIVTDQKGVRQFTDAFSAVAPGEARGFNHLELQNAIDWVSTPVTYELKDKIATVRNIAFLAFGIILLKRLFKKR